MRKKLNRASKSLNLGFTNSKPYKKTQFHIEQTLLLLEQTRQNLHLFQNRSCDVRILIQVQLLDIFYI